MGLFGFFKKTGEKLFGDEDEAAEKIKENIEAANPGISDLGVNYSDGVVELTGSADSAEAMEKAVLMAGNVKGVSEVKADGLSAPHSRQRLSIKPFRKGIPSRPLPRTTTERPVTTRGFSKPTARSSRIPI